MKPALKERLGRLGRIQAVARVPSGSAVILLIKPSKGLADVRTIAAARHLAGRGVSLLRAKRAVERMIERGSATIQLPAVESKAQLATDLAAAGVRASSLQAKPVPVDVRALREARGLTQEEFALRFALSVDVIRNWEQGRNVPDAAANAYLVAIKNQPDAVAAAFETPLAD